MSQEDQITKLTTEVSELKKTVDGLNSIILSLVAEVKSYMIKNNDEDEKDLKETDKRIRYQSVYDMKKEADNLYREKKYKEAVQVYLKCVDLFLSFDSPSNSNSCHQRVASCYMRLGQFNEAGNTLVSMTQNVIDREQKLLMFSVSTWLKHAAMCYWLGDQKDEYYKVLTNPYLKDIEKKEVSTFKFSKTCDPDELYLQSLFAKS